MGKMNDNKFGFTITISEIDSEEMETIEIISLGEVIDIEDLKAELKDKFNQVIIYIDKFLIK